MVVAEGLSPTGGCMGVPRTRLAPEGTGYDYQARLRGLIWAQAHRTFVMSLGGCISCVIIEIRISLKLI